VAAHAALGVSERRRRRRFSVDTEFGGPRGGPARGGERCRWGGGLTGGSLLLLSLSSPSASSSSPPLLLPPLTFLPLAGHAKPISRSGT